MPNYIGEHFSENIFGKHSSCQFKGFKFVGPKDFVGLSFMLNHEKVLLNYQRPWSIIQMLCLTIQRLN